MNDRMEVPRIRIEVANETLREQAAMIVELQMMVRSLQLDLAEALADSAEPVPGMKNPEE